MHGPWQRVRATATAARHGERSHARPNSSRHRHGAGRGIRIPISSGYLPTDAGGWGSRQRHVRPWKPSAVAAACVGASVVAPWRIRFDPAPRQRTYSRVLHRNAHKLAHGVTASRGPRGRGVLGAAALRRRGRGFRNSLLPPSCHRVAFACSRLVHSWSQMLDRRAVSIHF